MSGQSPSSLFRAQLREAELDVAAAAAAAAAHAVPRSCPLQVEKTVCVCV